MKNIKIITKDENGLAIEYEESGRKQIVRTTDLTIVKIIEILCSALHKDFPENYKLED